MDEQIRELDEATEGTGVEVTETEDGSAIMVNLPDGVTFAVNSTEISPGFQYTLDQIANSMIQYPNSLIDVYGHTDSSGTDEYNLGLSQRRADAVADYLVMRGVSRARIETIGYGERYPIASNDTVEGKARNRRVEIKITPISQEEVEAARRGSQ
jgi:outer membrane protein OmpA-like peptidoglycan-associated protein